jgi:hypothetical protein
MSDLERRLEELFMSDARARRVNDVSVATRTRAPLGALAFIGAVAAITLASILALNALRGPSGDENAAAVPSASPSVTASSPPGKTSAPGTTVVCGRVTEFTAPTSAATGRVTVQPDTGAAKPAIIDAGTQLRELSGYICMSVELGAPASGFRELVTPGMQGYVAEGGTVVPSKTPTTGVVRPDASHGIITRGGTGGILRTEADSAARSTLRPFRALAVTPDGKRVAYVRAGETGMQLIVFDTVRPEAQKTVMEFTGLESAGGLVWSSDGSDEVLIQVDRRSQTQPPAAEFSSLRAVNVDTGAAREIVRSTTALLVPIVWHSSTNTGAAVETGDGGFAISYDYISGGALKRSPLPQQVGAFSIRADADGKRILSIGPLPAPRGVLWWPIDRPEERHELKAAEGWDVSVALWRAGSDEIVVFASPTVKAPGPGPRIEIWTTDDKRRTVTDAAGPLALVRVDGTAAITTGWNLVDLTTGAVTEIPGADRTHTPAFAVLF